MKNITVQNQLSLGFRPVSVEPRVGLLLTGKHFFIEIYYFKKGSNTYLHYESFLQALLARRAIGNGLTAHINQDLTAEFTLHSKDYEFEVCREKIDVMVLMIDKNYHQYHNGSLNRIRQGDFIAGGDNLVMEADNISHCQQSYSYCLFFDSMAVFLPFYFIPYIEDAIKKTKPIFATDCQTGQFFIPRKSLEQTIAYIKCNLSHS